MTAFEDYAFASVAAALADVGLEVASDVYVVSLLVYDEEDDPRAPTITVGFNTETQVAAATPSASSAEEARWNYAFWLQNELYVLGDGERDPEGAALRRAWIEAEGLWYSDDDETRDFDASMEKAAAITSRFVAMTVRVVRGLHASGVVERSFGRSLPVLIHELEYYDEIAEQNRAANPPELVADFTGWVLSGQ